MGYAALRISRDGRMPSQRGEHTSSRFDQRETGRPIAKQSAALAGKEAWPEGRKSTCNPSRRPPKIAKNRAPVVARPVVRRYREGGGISRESAAVDAWARALAAGPIDSDDSCKPNERLEEARRCANAAASTKEARMDKTRSAGEYICCNCAELELGSSPKMRAACQKRRTGGARAGENSPNKRPREREARDCGGKRDPPRQSAPSRRPSLDPPILA